MSYSWGDDTSVSSNSGGFSYRSARKAHSDPARTYAGGRKKTPRSVRTYTGTRKKKKAPIDVPDAKKHLKTDSPCPLVVAVDVTGSMGKWPGIIFEKLPLLYTEIERYMPEAEVSFAAVGDANSDKYPLQVTEFAKGRDLDAKIRSLYPERGGGGTGEESYELAGYFYLKHCDMPNAKKPMLIFTGDERFYDYVNKKQVKKHIGDKLEWDEVAHYVMKDLADKYDTYLVRKLRHRGTDKKIKEQWERVLGHEHVVALKDPKRIVDTVIGIVAAAAGDFTDYSVRLSKRQTKNQVNQVMKSLRAVHKQSTSIGGVKK